MTTKAWKAWKDRSSKSHHSPKATSVDVVSKIVYLRQNYHFGPQRIAVYLQSYHDITVSTSGVWRILKLLDLNRVPVRSATSEPRRDGSVTRSSGPGITCRST